MEGVRLHKSFICKSCEYNMVHTDVREVKYRYYVEKLKSLDGPSLRTS
ncbi:MAG: hypothetical protein GX374_01695 [Bacilli bacterium]|nr:hypothetical protein [Bacilli bacterium]